MKKSAENKVITGSNCARLKSTRKHSLRSFARSAHFVVLVFLLTVGLVPFSATPSYAWEPGDEPVLSDGTYYIRPYLQAADGSCYEGSYSIGINDHGAAWHNDAITYSENNPIKLEKTSTKNSQGRVAYTLYDDGGWFGAFRRFTNSYASGACGTRLVGCSPEWDTLNAEYFSFEFVANYDGSPNKWIVIMWEGAKGSAPIKVALEEGHTKNSKGCHLKTVRDDVVAAWVLTKK